MAHPDRHVDEQVPDDTLPEGSPDPPESDDGAGWVDVLKSRQRMADGHAVSEHACAWHDDSWNGIIEELKDDGVVPEERGVLAMDISVTVEGLVYVQSVTYETEDDDGVVYCQITEDLTL